MRVSISVAAVLLFFCTALFGQSATQNRTFHVSGTVTIPVLAVIPGVEVVFEGGQLSTTVTTNAAGIYEADLPLGVYSMTAQHPGFWPYRRGLFEVMSPTTLSFDATLRVQGSCDLITFGNLSPEERTAAQERICNPERDFTIPSKGRGEFRLCIQYRSRSDLGLSHSYTDALVAYNLFTLRADNVTYDEKQQTIEARGGVFVSEASAVQQRFESVLFKISDGRVARIR
jgi:hypothetical protein